MSGEQHVNVVAEIKPTQDRQCVLVILRSNEPIPMKNTIDALEKLAEQLREQFKIPKPKASNLILP